MRVVRRFQVVVLLAALLVPASAAAQGIAPTDLVEGIAVGAFNTHGSQDIVRGLPERGVQNLWARHGAPSVLFAAIEMAERNSFANFPPGGAYRAAVSTSAEAALAGGRGDFLERADEWERG